MNANELRALRAELRAALDLLAQGEMYAHHARWPVRRALQQVTAALAAKETSNVASLAADTG